MSCVHPSGWPAVSDSRSCVAKTLTLKVTRKLFNQMLSYLPYFIGTIFILLSLTLTLPGSHKVSIKQNLLASFSPILFF